MVDAFELDADGEVVAPRSTAPAGSPGMPGTLIKRDELPRSATSVDKKMGRHGHASEIFQRWIGCSVQAIQKKIFHHRCAKFSGWKRNAMNYHQADVAGIRSQIPIGGVPLSNSSKTMIFGYVHPLFSSRPVDR